MPWLITNEYLSLILNYKWWALEMNRYLIAHFANRIVETFVHVKPRMLRLVVYGKYR
jgi:hypothetical protein